MTLKIHDTLKEESQQAEKMQKGVLKHFIKKAAFNLLTKALEKLGEAVILLVLLKVLKAIYINL